MDLETEAPIDQIEAIDAVEDEDEISYAALRMSSDDPTAC